ncbi:TOM1-like protein 2 [Armadillidium nasatum]|uniref:TOM1-like protein 2 n=1 Tax=Armadillidium nasatum TaxID=96803 RepID=A0A5N5SSB5_9CRUS|nr:TOM1-like protein 2 [Armadillidium nasatum]
MAFFGVGGNPFATPVGMKVEKATCESLPSEDWALNMEICDLINHSEDGPKDAMKAIRKRLTTQPKNYTVVMYTLTVLESCVKNCGKRFHVLACSKDFVQELVKLIGPKNDPPTSVQEKVLSLIQSWAETFRHQPELSGVCQVYADLKHKGVEFPAAGTENATPILTPQRSNDLSYVSTQSTSVSPSRREPQITYQQREHPVNPSIPATLSAEQKAKLHSELDLVESNAKVLAEMLNELKPGKEQDDDLQLLQDLHATCRAMQERVVELVGRVSDDLLTADLLRINDDLNNLFVRYDRHMSKNRTASSNSSSPVKSPIRSGVATATVLPPLQQQPSQPQPKKEEDAPLIDLGGDENVPPSQQLASLNIGNKNEDVDFDVFAQSRTTTEGAKLRITYFVCIEKIVRAKIRLEISRFSVYQC